MSGRRPAVLGGDPAFPDGLPFARPLTPPLDAVVARLGPSYESGMLTNGPLVRELEEAAAARLGVAHVVAVSSCTAGLMLVLRTLSRSGDVVVPSFTFSASAHAVAWNGRAPRFVECDPRSFQIDLDDLDGRGDGVAAVLATHVFGAPCAAEDVVGRAAELGVPAVFDAAHAFGARRGDRPVGGFGLAEVFSMSPTKLVVAGEGGLVATDDAALAEEVRLGRDYGNPGDYDTRFAGLNARLSELHAAVALESLARLDEHLTARADRAERYRAGMAGIPGVEGQEVPASDRSTWKDLTVQVDAEVFGLARDQLVAALHAEGVDTRCYFSPPVHRQQAYAGVARRDLPVTDAVAGGVVSLPLFARLPLDAVDRIVEVLASLHAHAEEAVARQEA